MDRLYLIATIAGQPVAMRAAAIDSVVDIGAVIPIPAAPVHVAGLAALRSRVLTVICSEAALGLSGRARSTARGVVVAIDGHHYAIAVGGIDDACVIVAEPQPVRIRLEPGWAAVAEAMLPFGDEMLLLIDPVRLIEGRSAPMDRAAA